MYGMMQRQEKHDPNAAKRGREKVNTYSHQLLGGRAEETIKGGTQYPEYCSIMHK